MADDCDLDYARQRQAIVRFPRIWARAKTEGAIRCACTIALLTGILAVPIVAEGQVVVSADAGGGLLSATAQLPPGSVMQLAVAFPVTSSTRHWPLEVSFGRTHWRADGTEASVKYLGLGVRRVAAALRDRRVRPVGRLGVGRYSFGKSTAGAVRWGGYAGFGIDVGVSARAAISGGLALHLSRGPNDGPLRAYLSYTGMALVGFRMTF